jgi:uncharacterized protein (DUF1800 family)
LPKLALSCYKIAGLNFFANLQSQNEIFFMAVSHQLKNQHLMWRAGFGPAAAQIPDLSAVTPNELYKALQKASAKKPVYIDVADDYLKGLVMGFQELGRQQKKELPKEEKKMIQQKNREAVRNLNLYWLNEMTGSDAQLREKMAFFWHGHFACRNLNVFFQQQLLDVIRRNALGNFRDLLHEVSKTAAMLNFLNNNQNRKDHPNENFAREVMELFTLGRGHYSEQDVKEAARAFTGWGANIKGEFVFRKFQHDDNSKTFLAKTGNFDGDDVLEMILDKPQTAQFICRKIYRFFVNEQVDEDKVAWLADFFYKNDYDISRLMQVVFTSDWFYDEKNIGCKIKSPVELIAGLQRILPMKLQNEEALLIVQRVLGQLLFYPPNVAGWPGGRAWIDSSTLMMRMRLPQLINDTDELNVTPKSDDDQMMGRKDDNISSRQGWNKMRAGGSGGKAINAEIDWPVYIKNFENTPREKLIDGISAVLLQTKTGVNAEVIKQFSDESNRDILVKTATIQLMSTPEYQLC